VASLDAKIDELYQGPPEGFVRARTALAKTLGREESKRVKALQKPAAVPWAVNQVYWHARSIYDRLVKSGAALRSAQIAALGGRSADVRGASQTHRQALAAAVKEAQRLGERAGLNPSQDALTQTLEALSLAGKSAEPPGRLTTLLQPAGFEALAGVALKASPAAADTRREAPIAHRAKSGRETLGPAEREREREKREQEQEQEAAAQRQREAELRTARATLAQARRAEANARSEWESRKRDLEAAERTLARLEKP
jgi:hypothetical protein